LENTTQLVLANKKNEMHLSWLLDLDFACDLGAGTGDLDWDRAGDRDLDLPLLWPLYGEGDLEYLNIRNHHV
jgi:hypothetical protein